MLSSELKEIFLVFKKEFTMGIRFKAAWLTMLMFSITTLSVLSLTQMGGVYESSALSSLYWTAIFFSAATGIDRIFLEEEFSGTIKLLRIYGKSHSILLGKILYGFILLLILSIFITLLFFILLDVSLPQNTSAIFFITLVLGVMGLSTAGVFLAALSASSKVKSGLFPALMLPVMLPVLLPSANITFAIFTGEHVNIFSLAPIFLYDLILLTSASVLFDYVWYEDF